VSWEKVLTRLRDLPAIARAIQREPAAAALLDQAARRDGAADFVQDRVTIDVVAGA
jgi:hypothetical protein